MKTQDYLDAVKEKRGIDSDYALSKILDLTRSAISNLRLGKSQFGDETCLKVATILEVPASQILIDMHLERSKAPEVKAAWAEIMEKIKGFLALSLHAKSGRRFALPR